MLYRIVKINNISGRRKILAVNVPKEDLQDKIDALMGIESSRSKIVAEKQIKTIVIKSKRKVK